MRRYLAVMLAIACVPALIVGAINYAVDPMEYFRKAGYFPVQEPPNERFINPGFAKNYAYDGVILGSSTSQNFKPSQVKREIGGNFIKLTMMGGRVAEQAVVLDSAFRAKGDGIKKVIWGIDQHFWIQPVTDRNPLAFPQYLYDDNIAGIATNYLLSGDILKMSLRAIEAKRKDPAKRFSEPDFDTLHNWNDRVKYGCQYVEKQISKWVKPSDVPSRDRVNPRSLQIYTRNIREQLDKHLLPFIKENSSTEFYLFIPPFSVAENFVFGVIDPAVLLARAELKNLLVKIADEHRNVKFYDFQPIKEITTNLDNYYDWEHFSGKISDYLITYMAHNDRLAPDPTYVDWLFTLRYETVFKQCAGDENAQTQTIQSSKDSVSAAQ